MYKPEAKGAFAYTYEEMLFFIESELAPGEERLTLEYPGDSEFSGGVVRKDKDQTRPLAFGGADVIGATAPDRHYWEGLEEYVNSHAGGDSRLRSTLPAAVRIHDNEVVPIDRHVSERARQGLTLEAMHAGADFIVAGQLVTGQFAGLVDIMVREEGRSDFGDYFYMPCGIRNGDESYAALRLCFIADLLQNLQGVLPPQLKLFHNRKGPESLDTEKYIQYFRALKYRFITSRAVSPARDTPQATGFSHLGVKVGSGLRTRRGQEAEVGDNNIPEARQPIVHNARTGEAAWPSDSCVQVWSLAAALDELIKSRNPKARFADMRAQPTPAENEHGFAADTNDVAVFVRGDDEIGRKRSVELAPVSGITKIKSAIQG